MTAGQPIAVATTASAYLGSIISACPIRRSMRIALLEELGFPDLDPVVISIEAKLRRAGKGKRLVIENGVEAEVNAGLVATNFLTRQAYSDFVKPLTASIGVLLRKEIDLGSFDLIYAAGIYDCLQDDLFRQTGTSPLTKPPLTSLRRRRGSASAAVTLYDGQS